MLDDLLLLRLWAIPEVARGEIRSRVAADLRPLVHVTIQGQKNWPETFRAATERLAGAGLLTVGGRGGARLSLSDAGVQRVRTTFKIAADADVARPGGKRAMGWAWWRDHHALPLALGGEFSPDANGLRSALLQRLFLPELPPGRRPAGLSALVDLLLAQRLQVSQATPTALRQAALRDWAARGPAPVNAPGSIPVVPNMTAAVSESRLPDDPALFAQQTLAAARRSPTGRFGDAKVFVSHVWRELRAAGQAGPDELSRFKERLVQGNTAGRLRLSRADLAGAHDAEDVRASEVRYLGEIFHFVRLD